MLGITLILAVLSYVSASIPEPKVKLLKPHGIEIVVSGRQLRTFHLKKITYL